MPTLLEALRKHVPDAPLLAAGALGGPFVIISLTPLRNVMSNAAQDQSASLAQLYARVGGVAKSSPLSWLRTAYTGARVSGVPACPQWCVIGPAFHFFHATGLPTPAALLSTAALETFIVFGSQSRNAQMAYNVQVPAAKAVPLFNQLRPWGPGAEFFVLRNACGMAGIRWLSPPIQTALAPALPSGGPREICSDILASFATCVVSAPLNACHAFTVTTPTLWALPLSDRLAALRDYLKRQYLDPTGARMFSPLAMRDLGIRCVYISCCFTMFSAIERLAVKLWPRGSE